MKKNFSLKFMAMAMVAALIAAPGCKDYDDDINNLREQTAGLTSGLEQTKKDLADAKAKLEAQIKDVEGKAAEAKKAAEKAWADAQAADAALKAELQTLAEKAQKTADEANKKADELKTELQALKTSVEALEGRVKTLETNSATKEELNKVKTDLETLIAKEKTALGDKIAKEKAALETKINDLEASLNKKIDGVEAALRELIAAEKKFLLGKIAALDAKVEAFVGNRVTSIALIPTYHVNGIAAAELVGVAYKAQAHEPHAAFLFTTVDASDAKVFLPSQGEVMFRLSPSTVSAASFTQPAFETWVSKNRLRVEEGEVGRNVPFKAGEYKLDGNILTVNVVKTGAKSLNQSEHWANEFITDPWCEDYTAENPVEKFYMGALSLPIAEAYWTEAEKAATDKPMVESEGFRVDEIYVAPVIKSKIATGKEVGYIDAKTNPGAPVKVAESHHAKCAENYHPYAYDDSKSMSHYFDLDNNGAIDDASERWGRPTHFSDSTLLYSSKENQLVDVEMEWNKSYDLMQYVDAATKASHETFDYKKHGLGFHFAVAKGKYLQGTNQTDQQEFAVLNGSVLTNKVYSIGGVSETAIGREPIIRITLYDLASKAVVDQRYMKIKWIRPAEIKPIGTSVFDPFLVNCEKELLRLDTKRMNEEIYRQAEAKHGVAKPIFTDRYTRMEILSLTKDGEYIVKGGKFVATDMAGYTISTIEQTGSAHDADLALHYLPEGTESNATISLPPEKNAGNTSFNIVWKLSSKVMRTIAPAGSTFVLEFKFVDRLNRTHFTHKFQVVVNRPDQSFNYEETYWSAGKMGQEFKVNPIVYAPGNSGDSRKSAQADYDNSEVIVHGAEGVMKEGDSHIQADLMTGFLYKGTKPMNLGQFIKYIGSCAKVTFQFDESRFGEFEHLSGFKVGADGTTLWDGTVGAVPANKDFAQDDVNFAASILNFLSVTADTNANSNLTYPWDKNEAIENGNGNKDEARALIRLHEDKASVADEVATKATAAAMKLVGKKVPVKIVVEYNEWNKVDVKAFDVYFIEPLKVTPGNLGSLVDAKAGGSFTGELNKNFTFTDWNNLKVANTNGEPKILYKYYAVKTLKFDVKNAKTNIKNVDGNNVVEEGYKEGNLPYGRILQQVNNVNKSATPYWTYTVVDENPTHLRYANEHGTPVNVPYKIFLNVESGYKWATIITPREIPVSPAQGTNP